MRIGLITGEFPPMEGGVGDFTEELARALAAREHQVHIITHREARPAALRMRHLWRDLMEPVDLGYAQLHPRVRHWRWPSLSVAASVVIRHDLDLVNIQYQAAAYHMRSPATNFLPWRLKPLAKVVVTFHDLRLPYLFPKAGRLRQMALHFMARQAHGVIATNPEDFQALRRLELGPERLQEIPIGSNINPRRPAADEIAAARRRLGLAAGHTLLGYFGFLNESKGADALVQALARLDKDIHLVFIGGRTGSSDSGNNQAFLERLDGMIAAAGLQERVHWTGFLEDADVSAYLHAADLMVMPYRDGVSLRRGTLMAALAHSRPLITTFPATATPALLHGENVWFTPADDAAGLVQSIHTLLADKNLRQRLAENAGQLAQQFTWDKIAARSERFFRNLIDR